MKFQRHRFSVKSLPAFHRRFLLHELTASLAIAAAGCATLVASAEETEAAVPTVAVAVVTREDLAKEITLQAEFRPYQEIDLHAKASGYLSRINVDIGDSVEAGDLIGVLEVPELEDDLARALAAQQRAEADFKEAHLNYVRLTSVSQSRPNLVAQQDLDTAEEKDSAAAAAVEAAKADAKKYRTLADYTHIAAPFNGVITKRYADPGALIQAGTSSDTQTKPLIRLSENDRLRLDFSVSAAYAEAMKVGDSVEIHLDDHQEPMTGVISRFSRRITMETRTMETEVEVPNPDLKLIPGMYASVVLKLQRRPQALAIPVEAVSGNTHPTVYVVNLKQEIEERAVQLGLETPTKYEVLSGLHEGEQVMIGNRSQVHTGQKVSAQPIKLIATL
jgi:RND family efflux transporter MFP subunit